MGFFDNLFKGEAKKFVSNVVGNVLDNVADELRGNNGSSNNNAGRINNSVNNGNNSSMSSKGGSGERMLRSRLEGVMEAEYSDYELRRNVTASELGAEYGAADYSYGLYRAGAPAALFMVIDDRNLYRKKCMRLSREAAKAQGVPCMSFFSHLPNETGYISDRLRKNIFG